MSYKRYEAARYGHKFEVQEPAGTGKARQLCVTPTLEDAQAIAEAMNARYSLVGVLAPMMDALRYCIAGDVGLATVQYNKAAQAFDDLVDSFGAPG